MSGGSTSRRKGQTGEREVVHIFGSRGVVAKRGFQSRGGGKEEADVVTELPLHVEVKRVKERINIWAAFKQADDDCDPADDETVPVVVFRRDGEPWMVCLRFGDYLDQLGYPEVAS